MITRSTSIIGIRLIPVFLRVRQTSYRVCGLLEFERSPCTASTSFRRLLPPSRPRSLRPCGEMAEENHRWNGDHQTEARVVQCHGNAVASSWGWIRWAIAEPKISIMRRPRCAEQTHQRTESLRSSERRQESAPSSCCAPRCRPLRSRPCITSRELL